MGYVKSISLFFFLTLLGLSVSACEFSDEAQTNQDSELEASGVSAYPRIFEVRGRIVEVDEDERQMLVAHEDIPGLMPAMTMAFEIKTVQDLEKITPGDAVQFRLVMQDNESWIEGITKIEDDTLPEIEAVSLESEALQPSNDSIYLHDASWTNQDGQNVTLASFQGNPVVISMIFTRCGYACPRIVQDMKEIAAELPESEREKTQYVLVSMDPEYDKPDKLQLFVEAHNLDLDNWTLLTGKESDVRMLAALLGIRYKQDANGLFSHTNLITVLNERGEIVHGQKGLGSNPSKSVDTLTALFASGN